MNSIRRTITKPLLAASAAIGLAAIGGCSSVSDQPGPVASMQKTVPLATAPQATAAYALPKTPGQPTPSQPAPGQVAVAVPVAAASISVVDGLPVPAPDGSVAAERATLLAYATPQTAPAATAQQAVMAMPQSTPVTMQTTAAPPTQAGSAVLQSATLSPAVTTSSAAPGTTTTAASGYNPIAPGGIETSRFMVGAMDSDFDTGEPVGLETLVAKRMIVPVSRPAPESRAAGPVARAGSAIYTSLRPELDRLISFYAKLNDLPEELVHRVVKRESTYNPRAYSRGNYGLMQIRYNTARGLGYEGPPEGLFDAETNLKYATRYLKGAWVVAENQNDSAVKLYASGYYYHAKRKGLLEQLGMK